MSKKLRFPRIRKCIKKIDKAQEKDTLRHPVPKNIDSMVTSTPREIETQSQRVKSTLLFNKIFKFMLSIKLHDTLLVKVIIVVHYL